MNIIRALILLPLVFAAYIGKSQPLPNVVTEIPVPVIQTKPPYSAREIKCAADMVFGEANGEPFAGMAAAAAVAIRRSLSSQWPNDLCAVVQQEGQFAGYTKRADSPRLAQSYSSVHYAIYHLGEFPEAMYFHRKEIKGNYEYQYTIGNHTFYRRSSSHRRSVPSVNNRNAYVGGRSAAADAGSSKEAGSRKNTRYAGDAKSGMY